MWKPEYRIAADRSGLRYPSDLTGAERGQDLDGPHQGLASTVFRDRAQLMSAASSALVVAAATALDAASGSARPTSSIGLPAARPGYSSVAAAALSASRSSSVIQTITAIHQHFLDRPN